MVDSELYRFTSKYGPNGSAVTAQPRRTPGFQQLASVFGGAFVLGAPPIGIPWLLNQTNMGRDEEHIDPMSQPNAFMRPGPLPGTAQPGDATVRGSSLGDRTVSEPASGPDVAVEADLAIDQQQAILTAQEELEAEFNKSFDELELLEQIALDQTLSPESQELFDQLRAQKTEEIMEIDRAISQMVLNANIQTQQAVLQADPDYQFKRDELIVRADIENVKPGLTKEFFDAVMEAEGDPDALGALFVSEEVRQQLLTDVADFVHNKEIAKAGLKQIDADIIAAQRQEIHLPERVLEMQAGPQGAFNEGAYTAIQTIPEIASLPVEMSDELAIALTSIAQNVNLGVYSERAQLEQAVTATLQTITGQPGLVEQFDVQSVVSTIEQAAKLGSKAEMRAQNAMNMQKFSDPRDLMHATYQTLVINGVDPNMAAEFAGNPWLYQIIKSQSGGSTHFQNPDGSLRGLGGLTESMYDAVGGWEAAKGDAEKQLLVLYAYIANNFAGSARTAYESFLQSGGVWGTNDASQFTALQQEIGPALGPAPVNVGEVDFSGFVR